MMNTKKISNNLNAGIMEKRTFQPSKILLGRLFEMVDSQVEGEALAEALLIEYGSLSAVLHGNFEKLLLSGLLSEPCLEVLRLLNKLQNLSLLSRLASQKIKLSKSNDVVGYLIQNMSHQNVEQLRILFLSAKSTLISEEVICSGNANSVPIFVENVCERALLNKAKKVIVVHNHPPGDSSPSFADIEVTKSLQSALNPLNITLVDHIIIGKSDYTSILNSSEYRVYCRPHALI